MSQYTYYTLTAFSVKVPVAVKRSLTTMQITQFLVGASVTMLHSFLSYVIPVSSTRSAGAHASLPAGTLRPGALGSLKQLVFGADTAAASAEHVTTYTVQPCIMTSAETFAIWLNVLYLAPLTYLFVSFFIASYVKRSNAAHKAQRGAAGGVTLAEKAGWDAARGVEREVYGGENMVGGSSGVAEEDAPRKAGGRARRRAKAAEV